MAATTHGRFAKALSERLPDTHHVLLDDGALPNVTVVDPDKGVVVVHRDERTLILEDDGWVGPGCRVDPESTVMELRLGVVTRSGAPTDKVYAFVSAPSARGEDDAVSAADDDGVADIVRDRLEAMDDNDEETAVSLGVFASAWMASNVPSGGLDKLLTALRAGAEMLLPSGEAMFGEDRITVEDLFERDVFAPAVLVAASEDWALVASGEGGAPGFKVDLARDPGSILGWSLSGVDPATPFTVLGPVFAKLRTCIDAHGVLTLDPIVHQYAAWMEKHRVGGTVA